MIVTERNVARSCSCRIENIVNVLFLELKNNSDSEYEAKNIEYLEYSNFTELKYKSNLKVKGVAFLKTNKISDVHR